MEVHRRFRKDTAVLEPCQFGAGVDFSKQIVGIAKGSKTHNQLPSAQKSYLMIQRETPCKGKPRQTGNLRSNLGHGLLAGAGPAAG